MTTATEIPPIDVPKGPAGDVIRVSHIQFQGGDYVDTRYWYRDGDKLRPSKKGLRLAASLLPALVQALHDLDVALAGAGEPDE